MAAALDRAMRYGTFIHMRWLLKWRANTPASGHCRLALSRENWQASKIGRERPSTATGAFTDIEATQMTMAYCVQRADLVGYQRILTVMRDT